MANRHDLIWRKSSYSADEGQCVEIATLHGTVAVRDSKEPDGPALTFTPAAFAGLLVMASGASPQIRG